MVGDVPAGEASSLQCRLAVVGEVEHRRGVFFDGWGESFEVGVVQLKGEVEVGDDQRPTSAVAASGDGPSVERDDGELMVAHR
jgi:hypothetical protein